MERYVNDEGHEYFYNKETGESVWELPSADNKPDENDGKADHKENKEKEKESEYIPFSNLDALFDDLDSIKITKKHDNIDSPVKAHTSNISSTAEKFNVTDIDTTPALVQKQPTLIRRGVTLQCLQGIKDFVVNLNVKMTTQDVFRRLLLPMTEHEQCSWLELLERFDSLNTYMQVYFSSDGNQVIASQYYEDSIITESYSLAKSFQLTYDECFCDRVDIFVSSSPLYCFCELVAALEKYYLSLDDPPGPIAFWLDFLVSNEWDRNTNASFPDISSIVATVTDGVCIVGSIEWWLKTHPDTLRDESTVLSNEDIKPIHILMVLPVNVAEIALAVRKKQTEMLQMQTQSHSADPGDTNQQEEQVTAYCDPDQSQRLKALKIQF